MSALTEKVARLYAEGLARPPLELWPDPRIAGITTFKPAAVLMAITDRAEAPGPGLLMIHRPETMRAHPGQIAFPGGRTDPGENAIAAALREAEEELGIPAEQVRVIGTTDLYRTGSGYEITPVIAVIPADLPLVPSPDEVADWFEVPLDHALDPARHEVEVLAMGGGRRFVRVDWDGRRIWGITAALLARLAYRMDWVGVA